MTWKKKGGMVQQWFWWILMRVQQGCHTCSSPAPILHPPVTNLSAALEGHRVSDLHFKGRLIVRLQQHVFLRTAALSWLRQKRRYLEQEGICVKLLGFFYCKWTKKKKILNAFSLFQQFWGKCWLKSHFFTRHATFLTQHPIKDPINCFANRPYVNEYQTGGE